MAHKYENMVISREDANTLIQPFILNINGYRGISKEQCQEWLGSRFKLIEEDHIRNLGPDKDTIYYWNVLDYLSCFDPTGKNRYHNAQVQSTL